MSLLSEQIVIEWLSRDGYFTIRGIKKGNDEIDILAFKPNAKGKGELLHVEVQVSTNPVSYITDLSLQRQNEFNINGARNATRRTDKQLELTVFDWVVKKYDKPNKIALKSQLAPGLDCRKLFVHGLVRHPKELEMISKLVEVKAFIDIVDELKSQKHKFRTSSATDIIEVMEFASGNTEKDHNYE